jgi:hypothetical protein
MSFSCINSILMRDRFCSPLTLVSSRGWCISNLDVFSNFTIFKTKPLCYCFFDICESSLFPFLSRESHIPHRSPSQAGPSCILHSFSASAVVRPPFYCKIGDVTFYLTESTQTPCLPTLNTRKMIRGTGENSYSMSDKFALSLGIWVQMVPRCRG